MLYFSSNRVLKMRRRTKSVPPLLRLLIPNPINENDKNKYDAFDVDLIEPYIADYDELPDLPE